jgi:hypothetical protein
MGISPCGTFKRFCKRKLAQAPYCIRWLPGLNGPRSIFVRRALLGGMLVESEADAISSTCKACQSSKFPERKRAVQEGFGADYSGPYAYNGGHCKGCSKKHLLTKERRVAQQRQRQRQKPDGKQVASSAFFQPRASPAAVPMDATNAGSFTSASPPSTSSPPVAAPMDVEPTDESEVVELARLHHREAFIDHMLQQSTKTAPHVPPYVMTRCLRFAYDYIMDDIDWPAGELPTLTLDGANKPLGERTTLFEVDAMVNDYKNDGWVLKIVDPSKLGEDVAVDCCHCGSSNCRPKKQHMVHLIFILYSYIFIK